MASKKKTVPQRAPKHKNKKAGIKKKAPRVAKKSKAGSKLGVEKVCGDCGKSGHNKRSHLKGGKLA